MRVPNMRWKIRTLFLLLAACTFQTVQSAAGQAGTTSGQSNVINLLCKGDYFKTGEGHIYIDLDKESDNWYRQGWEIQSGWNGLRRPFLGQRRYLRCKSNVPRRR